MFCKKCGTQIADGGTFCPKCGTPVGGSSGPTPNRGPVPNGGTSFTGGTPGGGTIPGGYTGGGSSGNNSLLNRFSQKQLLIAAGAVVVAVVLVIVLLANLLGGSPKSALKEYYKAIEKESASKIVDCIPKDLLKDIEESYDNCDKDDIIKAVDRNIDGRLENDFSLDNYFYYSYGAGDKVDYKITDKDTMKEKKVKSYRRSLKYTLEDSYEIELDKFDTSKIKKGFVLEVEYEDGEYEDGDYESDEIFLKYKGDWYSYNIICLVAQSIYYYA